MKGLEPTGTSEQKYTKPYFHSDEPLKLPAALPDVTGDAKKRETVEALMKPVTVGVKIPSRLIDNHFGQEIFAEPVSTEAGETYEREPIAQWLETHDTNPTDNEKLENKNLRPDKRTLREVNEFLDKNPALRDSAELYLPRGWVRDILSACITGDLATIKRLGERDRRLLSWTFDFPGEQYDPWRGKTLMHLACAQGTPEAVMQLLTLAEKRAEGLALLLLLKKDSAGKLPIQYAMQPDRDPRLMRLLAAQMGKHLADVEPVAWPTPEGQKPRQLTALHLAAMNNATDLMKTLLEHKADLTVKDGSGHTALHMAVGCGATQAIEILVTASASAEVENDEGQTPQVLGTACGQTDAVAVLQNIIAKMRKNQQGQLQDAGPMGLALLQVQQLMEQMQIMFKAQSADMMAELLELRVQQAVISAELGRYRAAFHYSRQQIDVLTKELKPEMSIWRPIPNNPYNVPASSEELRQLVVKELPSHPFAKEAKLYLAEVKDYIREHKAIHTLEHPDSKNGFFLAVSVFSDGRIVGGDSIGCIRIWNTKGECTATLTGHTDHITALAIMPDDCIASGSYDNSIKIWDAKGECTATLTGHDRSITHLVILSDGCIASADDNSIRIWQTNGYCKFTLNVNLQQLRVESLAALSNRRLASGHPNGVIKIWDDKGTCVTTLKMKTVYSIAAIAILDDGKLVSKSESDEIEYWDLNTGKSVGSTKISDDYNHYFYLRSDSRDLVTKRDFDNDYETYRNKKYIKFNSNNVGFLSNNQGVIHAGKSIDFHYLGKPVNLDVSFRSSLLLADAQLYTSGQKLHVHTAVPCEADLKAMAKALQTLCPEQQLTITVTATDLRITDVPNESLFTDLENLCQVFGASKLTPAPMLKPVIDLQPVEIKRHRGTGLLISPPLPSMVENFSATLYHTPGKGQGFGQEAKEQKQKINVDNQSSSSSSSSTSTISTLSFNS